MEPRHTIEVYNEPQRREITILWVVGGGKETKEWFNR